MPAIISRVVIYVLSCVSINATVNVAENNRNEILCL